MESAVDCSFDFQSWLQRFSLDGSSSKTSLGFLIATTEKISESSSKPWMNSGIAWHGESWTRNISEAPSAAEERSLSQVIERTAPLESFLAPELLTKWLNRNDSLERTLPADLRKAIETQISTLSSMRRSEESTTPGRKPKATGTTGKRTRLTPEEAPTLYVRRMLASECERLQGFPENWTDVDSERVGMR